MAGQIVATVLARAERARPGHIAEYRARWSEIAGCTWRRVRTPESHARRVAGRLLRER